MGLAAWLTPAFAERKDTLRRRFWQTVSIEQLARRPDGSVQRDGYGKPVYLAPVSYPARVEGNVQMTRNASGAETVSNTTIYLAGDTAITPEDRLTLPSGLRPSILSIATLPDERQDVVKVVLT